MGRPPAAPDYGANAKTSLWPRIAFNAPPDLTDTVKGLSFIERRAIWRIVGDAVKLYVKNLPDEKRRRLDAILGSDQENR
jgi:hypothetical protein